MEMCTTESPESKANSRILYCIFWLSCEVCNPEDKRRYLVSTVGPICL
jgi:hypothetical protein